MAGGADHEGVGGESFARGFDGGGDGGVALEEGVDCGDGGSEGDVATESVGEEADIVEGVIGDRGALGGDVGVSGEGGDWSVGGIGGIFRPVQSSEGGPTAEDAVGVGAVGIGDVRRPEVNHSES